MNREIEDLIGLLTCSDINPQEGTERAAHVRNAPQGSDAMGQAICQALNEYLVEGDHPHEIHELVSDAFAEPFPPFPYHDKAIQERAFAYFQWLDSTLAPRGYAMVRVPFDTDDRVRLFLVKRQDVPRIMALVRQLDGRIYQEEGRSG